MHPYRSVTASSFQKAYGVKLKLPYAFLYSILQHANYAEYEHDIICADTTTFYGSCLILQLVIPVHLFSFGQFAALFLEFLYQTGVILPIDSPALSHHLRQLKTRRLIVSHRSGKEVYYKAADTPQVHTLHSCLERLISLSDSTEHQTEVSNDTETR